MEGHGPRQLSKSRSLKIYNADWLKLVGARFLHEISYSFGKLKTA